MEASWGRLGGFGRRLEASWGRLGGVLEVMLNQDEPRSDYDVKDAKHTIFCGGCCAQKYTKTNDFLIFWLTEARTQAHRRAPTCSGGKLPDGPLFKFSNDSNPFLEISNNLVLSTPLTHQGGLADLGASATAADPF